MQRHDPRSPEAVAEKLLHEFCGWAEMRLEDPFSLRGASEIEADVLGTVTAKGVIGNGGFAYWYEGKDREATLRVAAGFDRMGMPAAAEAMRSSLSAFPLGLPPVRLGDRQRYVWDHRAELESHFAPLDKTIWKEEYDLAAARYLMRRRAEVLALEPRFRALLDEFATCDLKQ